MTERGIARHDRYAFNGKCKPIAAEDVNDGSIRYYKSVADAVRCGFCKEGLRRQLSAISKSPYKGAWWRVITDDEEKRLRANDLAFVDWRKMVPR